MGVKILQAMLFMMDAYAQQEWRREILTRFDRLEARVDRLEANQRWIIGLMIGLHGVTIGAIFAAAALF